MRIGIDLMGSDTSPQVLFEAVLQAAELFDASHTFIVLAAKDVVEQFSNLKHPAFSSPAHAHIEFHLVSDVITMCDEPLSAIRHKKGSSLIVGIRLMKKHLHRCFCFRGKYRRFDHWRFTFLAHAAWD